MVKLAEHRPAECDLACPEEIVVATDLVDTERLIPYAVAQAKAAGAGLTFVHAVPPEDLAEVKPNLAMIDLLSPRTAMEDVARRVRAEGVSCSTVVSTGPVADVVDEVLRRTKAGRLIVATHARKGVDKFLQGSVAGKLLESVDVPVLIVGPQCATATANWTVRSMLVACSSLDKRTPKTMVVRALAKQSNAELMMLHVLPPDRHANQPVRPAHAFEESNLEPHGGDAGQSVSMRVTTGDPAVEIVRVANEISADLIVLGVHHSMFRIPFGKETTAYKVLASASCPVLTLRSDSALIRKHALTETRRMAAL